MTGIWLLSFRHLLHYRIQAIIVTLCIAVTLSLPATSFRLIDMYQRDLVSRADATPLLAGARGNRFDLTLGALYFRHSELEPITYAEFEKMSAMDAGVIVPVNVRHTARDYPLVGTTLEYFDARALRVADGKRPLRMGDVVIGAEMAETLDKSPGDSLFSDQRELYDISKPPALKMRITGVLAPTGTPDDRAAFVDIKTIWVLEGLSHGHQDAEQVENPNLLYGKTDETVVLSPALVEFNEITPENIGSFHIHGETDSLPLSSVLVWPRDDKAGTILKAEVNAQREYQMLVPRHVIDDLMAVVFRIKSVFDMISLLLAGSTIALTVLVIWLSMKIRSAEIDTLHKIGCSPFIIAQLYSAELALMLGVSLVLASIVTALVPALLPNLIQTL